MQAISYSIFNLSIWFSSHFLDCCSMDHGSYCILMLPFYYPHFFTTFKLPKFFNQFQIPFLSSLVAKTLFKFSQNLKSLFISTNSPTGHVKIIISLFTSSLERNNKMWTIHLNSHRQVSGQLFTISKSNFVLTVRLFADSIESTFWIVLLSWSDFWVNQLFYTLIYSYSIWLIPWKIHINF